MTDLVDLTCLIVHPSIDPNIITEGLWLRPHSVQKAGAQVVTPKMTKVFGSYYGDSRWQYIKEMDVTGGLENELDILLDHLSNHAEFLSGITDDGGTISVFFRATDAPHIVLDIGPDTMSKMVDMKILFGFEFFTT